MTKPVIVTRLGKGSELTFQEGDNNFTNLRDATIGVSADSGSTQNIDLNGAVTISGGTGLSTTATTGTITVNIDNTAVTAGSYTNANITVNAQGQITAAANGFSGSYTDLTNKPTLGTASAQDIGYFATAAQGLLADSAVQPSDLSTVATTGSYLDLSNKPTIPTTTSQLTNDSGYITGINSSAVTTALGYTPENSANKNTANGYAGLDSNGKVASAQLPSYVDDVIEAANFAALPAEGEISKIYVALDNGKIYRWSGSAYVEISASPGSTDSVTEGSTNLYFTTQRARDAFSASTGITITNGAIATTITQYTDALARGAISVTDAGGDGSLSYNNSSGVITYTGPGTSDYRAAFTAGTGITINSGVISSTVTDTNTTYAISAETTTGGVNLRLTGSDLSTDDVKLAAGSNITLTRTDASTITIAGSAGGIASVSADTTPSLGGNLNVNGNSIVSASNGNIVIAPNGTGRVSLDGVLWPATDGTNGQVLTTNGSGSASWGTVSGGVPTAFFRINGNLRNDVPGASSSMTNITANWTQVYNTAGISIPSGGEFSLSAGTYKITWYRLNINGFGAIGSSTWNLRNTTDNNDVFSFSYANSGADANYPFSYEVFLIITGTKTLQVRSQWSGNFYSALNNPYIEFIKLA